MKKLIILLFIAFGFNVNSQTFGIAKGQTVTTNETPESVTKQFKKDYPAFNPIWSKEGDDYRADYTDPATNMSGMVVYNRNGRTLRTETEMQANSYPGSIGDYHTTNLPSRTRYKVYSAQDTTGIQSYYSTVDGKTYYFDKNGNYTAPTEPKPVPEEKKKSKK